MSTAGTKTIITLNRLAALRTEPIRRLGFFFDRSHAHMHIAHSQLHRSHPPHWLHWLHWLHRFHGLHWLHRPHRFHRLHALHGLHCEVLIRLLKLQLVGLFQVRLGAHRLDLTPTNSNELRPTLAFDAQDKVTSGAKKLRRL